MPAKTALGPLKKYRVKVILAPIFKAFESVCELIVPILVKQIVDFLSDGALANYTQQEQILFCLYRSLIVLGLAVAGFAVTMITQYLAARVAADYTYDLKKDLYAQLNSLSPRQIERFGSSKTLTILNSDSFSLETGVNMFMRLFVRSPFILIGSVVASFIVNVYAGLIVLGALVLSSIVVGLVMALTPKRYQAIQSQLDKISTLGEDSLSGARVIRAFNKQEDEQTRFEEASSEYRRRSVKLQKVNSFLNPLTFAFISLGIVWMLYLAGYQYGSTGIDDGVAVAIMSYFTQALTALLAFSKLVTSLTKAMASKKRVDEFLAIEPEIVDGPLDGRKPEAGENIFTLHKASLSYGGEEKALSEIDFVVNEGERIGVIGGTGSGKTSLIKLLERLEDADGGQVLYLGKDIKEYKLGAVRGQIALVSQKPQLYKGSVRSNVCLANPNIDEAHIEQALKDSLAYEFVSRYEDGLEHPINEGGSNLSGGQKQRILIARALASERPILILDDSTSALDYKSDLEVRRNIARRKLTSIIISQRATSIRDCDRIYVLDKGRLIASGKHEELLSSCPIYQQIYQTQVATK